MQLPQHPGSTGKVTCVCVGQLLLLALRMGAAATAPKIEWQWRAHLFWALDSM